MTDEERAEAARRMASYRPRTVKQCEVCGTEFETYATGRVGRYCSRPCQQRGYRLEHMEQERERQREQARKRRADPLAYQNVIRAHANSVPRRSRQ